MKKRITIEAFDLNEDFKEYILDKWGVLIVDETHGPWSVVFEGAISALREMLKECWVLEDDAIEYHLK